VNVGIVTTWFERGAAYVSRAYLKALSAQHDVFVYARGGEKYGKRDPRWNSVSVTYSPRWSSPFFPLDSAICRTHFWRWITARKIDVLLFNEQRDIGIVREMKACGVRCGAYVDYYTRESVSDFDVYDFLVCNTRRHYSVFKNHRNALYVPWGTDTELFRPPASPLPLDDGVVFFHSAGYGGANNRKGTDLLVRAFAEVKGRAKLIIHSQVPAANFGPMTARAIGADQRITFIHRCVGAPGLYSMGHVYVYPSRLDGIGLTVAEALSSGLPVVTTDSAPMTEFVTNNYNGLLVKVAQTQPREDGYYWHETVVDVADLAAKMQAYVDRPALILEHSCNARRSAVDTLNWSANCQALLRYFSRFVRPSCGVPPRGSTRVRWLLRDMLVALTFVGSAPLKGGLNIARRFRGRVGHAKAAESRAIVGLLRSVAAGKS